MAIHGSAVTQSCLQLPTAIHKGTCDALFNSKAKGLLMPYKKLTDDELYALYDRECGDKMIAHSTPTQDAIVGEIDRRAQLTPTYLRGRGGI